MKPTYAKRFNKYIHAVSQFILAMAMIQCSSTNADSAGTISLRASGQSFASDGFTFPPTNSGDPFFKDGWQVTFNRILVTFNNVVISENPDINPHDQSQVGAAVAHASGPWALDLQPTTQLPAAANAGTAFEIATISSKDDGSSFDSSQRYAFSFGITAASASAVGIGGLNPQTDRDYQTMITNGYTVMYIGQAQWMGGKACVVLDDPSNVIPALPTTVNFSFGFTTPVTYTNCQNPQNRGAPINDSEDSQRGLSFPSTGPAIAQMTVHVDHPFWTSNEEGGGSGGLRFDAIAAIAQQQATAAGTSTTARAVTLEDLASADYTSFSTTIAGSAPVPLPYRTCTTPGLVNNPPTDTNVGYDSKGIQVKGANGQASYSAFMAMLQSTQGHLNDEGICSTPPNLAL